MTKLDFLKYLAKQKRLSLSQEEMEKLSQILDIPTYLINKLALEVYLDGSFITFSFVFKKLIAVIDEAKEEYVKYTKIKDFKGTIEDENRILEEYFFKNILKDIPIWARDRINKELGCR